MYRIQLIKLAEGITHLSGEANYTRIHFANHKDLVLCRTISQCMAELPQFVRIHKRYLVNPDFVRKAVLDGPKGGYVLLDEGQLPISRRRSKEVLAALWQAGKLLN